MSKAIKLNYIFPKPYAQLYLDNVRAKRREQAKKRQTTKNLIATAEKYETKGGAQEILKCILKGKSKELKTLLESKQCIDVLMSITLEVLIKAKAKRGFGKKFDGNIVAKINFFHLAV